MIGNYHACLRAASVTPESVNTIAQALLESRDLQAKSIALAEAAAAALAPIAHHKVVNKRACTTIQKALPGVRAYIATRPSIYGKTFRQLCVSQRTETQHLQVWIGMDGDDVTMADLIRDLSACTSYRQELVRLTQQLDQMEEMLDAEKRIRALFHEIERIRKTTAEQLLSVDDKRGYYHDTVRRYLPALTD